MSSSLKRIIAVLILVLVMVPVLFAVPASAAHDYTNHSLDQILIENDYSYETLFEVVYRLSGYCSSETSFISYVDDSHVLKNYKYEVLFNTADVSYFDREFIVDCQIWNGSSPPSGITYTFDLYVFCRQTDGKSLAILLNGIPNQESQSFNVVIPKSYLFNCVSIGIQPVVRYTSESAVSEGYLNPNGPWRMDVWLTRNISVGPYPERIFELYDSTGVNLISTFKTSDYEYNYPSSINVQYYYPSNHGWFRFTDNSNNILFNYEYSGPGRIAGLQDMDSDTFISIDGQTTFLGDKQIYRFKVVADVEWYEDLGYTIKNAFGGFGDILAGIGEKVNSVIQATVDSFNDLYNFLSPFFEEIFSAIGNAINKIGDFTLSVIDATDRLLFSLGDRIGGFFTDLANKLGIPTWIADLYNLISNNFIVDAFNTIWGWITSATEFFSIPTTYDSSNLTFWDYILGRTGEDGDFWDYTDDAGFLANIQRFYFTVSDVWNSFPVPVRYLVMFGFGIPVSIGVIRNFLR